MEVIDPKEDGDINQEENIEQNKDVEAEAQESAEVLQEAKKEVKAEKKEAIAAEKKDSVATAEKEQSNSTEQEARPNTRPDFDAEATPMLPQVKVDSTQDLHLEVHLYAIWEPGFKVIYHRVEPKSDFAKDNSIEDAIKEFFYTEEDYKKSEGKFEVLDFESTELEKVFGYEFTYWTMEWFDSKQGTPSNPKEPDPDNSFNPGDAWQQQIEHLSEDWEAMEYLKEEVERAQDVKKMVKAVEASGSTEADNANKAEAIKEVEDVVNVSEEEIDLNEKIETEKENGEAGESTISEGTTGEGTDDPVGDDVEKIYPEDIEDLHAEVHLYAHWDKIYAIYWLDEDGADKDSMDNPIWKADYKDLPEGFDPTDNADADEQYNETGGPNKDTLIKEKEDGTYVFDHWEPEESGDDHVIIYRAVYISAPLNPGEVTDPDNPNDPEPDPVTPPTSGGRTTPTTQTEDPVTEEPTDIDDGETPLAGYEEEPGDIDDGDVPLAGAEEEEEIAEEATPLTPFTGDERNTAVWGIVSILSLLGIVLLTYKRRREE